MKLPFVILVLTLLLGGCKKDDPIAFYPKTYSQNVIEHSYTFIVHDKIVPSPPPLENYFSPGYRESAFKKLSFTLVNADTLTLKSASIYYYAYTLRNDTLYLKKTINTGEFSKEIIFVPFAYGNRAQFTVIETSFSYMPVPFQDQYNAWPYTTTGPIIYKDYSFFTDTAALLTVKRIFN